MKKTFEIGSKVVVVKDIPLSALSYAGGSQIIVKKGTKAEVLSRWLNGEYRFKFDKFETSGHRLTTDGRWVVDAEYLDLETEVKAEETKSVWVELSEVNHENLLVVATRDITENELFSGRESDKVRVPKGAMGRLNHISLDSKRVLSVNALDLDYGTTTTWNNFADAWMPAISRSGSYVKFENGKYVDFKVETNNLRKVGTTATVYGDIYHIKYGSTGEREIDENRVNYTYRDDDEVYILEVDAKSYVNDNSLVYRIGHDAEGREATPAWVRPCDLV